MDWNSQNLQTTHENCTRCTHLEFVECGHMPRLYCPSDNARVMIIGHSPSTRTKTQAAYVLNMDKPNRVLFRYISDEILKPLDLHPRDVYCTNLIKCFTAQMPEDINRNRSGFIQRVADNCVYHLENEIATIRPKLIISLSETVLKFISSRYIGRILRMKENNAVLFPIEINGVSSYYLPLVHLPTGRNARPIRAAYFPQQTARLHAMSERVREDILKL